MGAGYPGVARLVIQTRLRVGKGFEGHYFMVSVSFLVQAMKYRVFLVLA